MTVIFYISGHGFGHASRDIEVINEISRRRPDAHIVIRSPVPRWFVDVSLSSPGRNECDGRIALQPFEPDTGIVQIDSLTLDEEQTARRAAAFYADFAERIRSEAAVLKQLNASIVVGDIPPLAFAAAADAGIRSIALGNFTWDWIYEGYPQFERLAPGVIDQIRRANALATRALRLPFHGGLDTMGCPVTDIPLIARRAQRGRADTRRTLEIDDGELVAFASFGGFGLDLDYAEIARRNRMTVIVTDRELPHHGRAAAAPGRLLHTTSRDLADRGFRYVDLVAASDVVVTKPGYGIVSECIANGAALLYTSRGRFREYALLVAQMPAFLRCREISNADLKAGGWREAAVALLEQPPPPEHLAANGAEAAASEILAYTG
jgi:hypothetical protein